MGVVVVRGGRVLAYGCEGEGEDLPGGEAQQRHVELGTSAGSEIVKSDV